MTRQAVPNDQLVPFSNELVEQHLDAVFAYAFRLTCRSDWAEDLAQQAFLSACQHQQQLRNPDRVRQWLMSIVRNAYFNERRERRPVPASQLDVELLEVSQQTERDWFGDEERVQQALQQLCEEHRLVVLMFYFEDLSYREIAEELSLPIGTVMSRLSRAKDHLRRWLAVPEMLRTG